MTPSAIVILLNKSTKGIKTAFIEQRGSILDTGKYLLENLKTTEDVENFLSVGDRKNVEDNFKTIMNYGQYDNEEYDLYNVLDFCSSHYKYIFDGEDWFLVNDFEQFKLQDLVPKTMHSMLIYKK